MKSTKQPILALSCALLVAAVAYAPTAQAEWKIASKDGSSSIKFGILIQPRADSISPDTGSSTNNLYLRRFRVLAGGKINDRWSFFFETDTPNFGKRGADGSKNHGDIFVQDLVVTYKPQSDAFMLDIGQLLSEVTYNSNQSAVSLMAPDFAATSFVWAGALDTKVGRDYGIRARGYLAGDRLEYRASMLQGSKSDASSSLRFLGRLMYNFFEPQKGLFYAGTTLGKKKILSLGVSYDTQDDYKTTSVDFFYDQPIGEGSAVTLQASLSNIDGGIFLTSLPEQDNTMMEAGFYHGGSKLLPFVQYTKQDFAAGFANDVEKTLAGIGYFFKGHGGNVKLSYANVDRAGAPGQDELWLQLQMFSF